MKKFFSALGLITCLGLGMTNPAQALDSLSCKLSYDIKGKGFQLGVGYFKLKGTGKICCMDTHGNKTSQDVNVILGGSPLAPALAFGKVHMKGVSGSFGISDGNISSAFGHYLTLGVHGALGLGGGANFAFQNPLTRASISFAGEVSHGWAFMFGVRMVSIEAIEEPEEPSDEGKDSTQAKKDKKKETPQQQEQPQKPVDTADKNETKSV